MRRPSERNGQLVWSRMKSFGLSVLVLLGVFLCTPWVAVAMADNLDVGDRIGIDIHVDSDGNKLDLIAASGMGWVRVDFDWWAFEPAKGSFNWSVHDEVVTQARARGLNIFASIGYTPAWATDGDIRTGVPRNVSDWTSAVTAAVNRYGNDILHWGIWNEPNATSFWTGSRQDFIDVIFNPGADAIHAANPNAKVLGPELAHFVSTGRTWYVWMEDILTQASGKLDIISHHTYPRPLAGSYTTITGQLNNTTLFGNNPDLWGFLGFHPSVREVLRELNWNGDVWLTEFGWPLTELSEQQIADNYTGLFNDWLTDHPEREWIDKFFLYHSGADQYGIFNPDGSPRQAYFAIQDFIAAHSILPGDVNGDAWVGGDDLTIILTNWGQSVTGREQGDLNGDFFVGGDDYSEVLTYWGTGTPPESVITITPEPATIALLLLGGLVMMRRRQSA